MEEGHSMGNLVHILQLISRHHKLFAPWRNQLAHLIVQALQRLAMPTNSPLENRKLAIDLIAVVLDWEEWSRAQSEASPGTPTAAVGSKRPADDAGGAADEQPPAQRVKTESGSAPAGPSGPADASRAMPQVQYVVNFCQRMALMIVPLHQDSNNAGKVVRVEKDLLAMHAHTLTQFSRALALWPDTPVKFGNVLEKFLANDLK